MKNSYAYLRKFLDLQEKYLVVSKKELTLWGMIDLRDLGQCNWNCNCLFHIFSYFPKYCDFVIFSYLTACFYKQCRISQRDGEAPEGQKTFDCGILKDFSLYELSRIDIQYQDLVNIWYKCKYSDVILSERWAITILLELHFAGINKRDVSTVSVRGSHFHIHFASFENFTQFCPSISLNSQSPDNLLRI